jgi:hypothetical protein
LAEDNSRVNHTLATMVGSLHGQQQDIFPQGVTSFTNSSADVIANLSSNDHNSDSHLRTLSPCALITRNTTLFPNQISQKDSGFALNGSASSFPYMSMNSPHMSATALLQKAAEMGAKTSHDPISPLLVKSFLSNVTTPRDHIDISSGSQGDTLGNSATNSVGIKSAEDDGAYMGGCSNILIDVVSSDILSRNGKSVTMQDQSQKRTR